ncbi:hypothetical protein TIFTF001_042243 [Ficus carica]|uniref:Uncharacterized protein n=1 Tax=Ficus carica TaxID=3494 RepID=A0AA87ZKE8_FICCA|nr:hypothetical protein TIFTF001_042243 [Ficus carica]
MGAEVEVRDSGTGARHGRDRKTGEMLDEHGIPHRPSLAASSPWSTKYSCRHLTYSMKYLMSFRPANSIFNLLSCLNLWAHSVRTKSAQPPDKARVCKVPNSSGNFISLCDFTKGLVNLTLHDHRRSRSQLKHVASTITGGEVCTYLSCYVLRSAASPLGTAAGFLLLDEGHRVRLPS